MSIIRGKNFLGGTKLTSSRVLRWVTGAFEIFLAIPVLGAAVVIGTWYTALGLMFILHLVTLILSAKKQRAYIRLDIRDSHFAACLDSVCRLDFALAIGNSPYGKRCSEAQIEPAGCLASTITSQANEELRPLKVGVLHVHEAWASFLHGRKLCAAKTHRGRLARLAPRAVPQTVHAHWIAAFEYGNWLE